MKAAGFTLVELVVTLVIVGILAVVAMPRFFDRGGFESRGFTDEALAMLRYAQKTAIAQHRIVFVHLTAAAGGAPASVALCYGNPCDASNRVLNPANQAPFSETAPSSVNLPALVFSFDALGQPSAGQAIAVTGEVVRTIVVEPVTGYVHL